MDEVEKVYRQFWKPLVAKFGFIDMSQVKKELFDYYNILENASVVYDHITGGRISKPNTCSSAVISEYEARVQELIQEGIDDALELQEAGLLTPAQPDSGTKPEKLDDESKDPPTAG